MCEAEKYTLRKRIKTNLSNVCFSESIIRRVQVKGCVNDLIHSLERFGKYLNIFHRRCTYIKLYKASQNKNHLILKIAQPKELFSHIHYSKITLRLRKCKKNYIVPLEMRNLMSISGNSGSTTILKIFSKYRFNSPKHVCKFAAIYHH